MHGKWSMVYLTQKKLTPGGIQIDEYDVYFLFQNILDNYWYYTTRSLRMYVKDPLWDNHFCV